MRAPTPGTRLQCRDLPVSAHLPSLTSVRRLQDMIATIIDRPCWSTKLCASMDVSSLDASALSSTQFSGVPMNCDPSALVVGLEADQSQFQDARFGAMTDTSKS